MVANAVPHSPRRRGRPRVGEATDTRARILSAAVEEFAEAGYDGATMRAIAARARVDASLLHHYFGTKADLFTETIGAPIRPDLLLPAILAGPRDQLGERVVRTILEVWERPEVARRGAVLLRTGIGNRLTTPLLAGFLAREVLGRLAGGLTAPDADLRAALAGSQIAGLLIARYILTLPALVAAPLDDLVARVGPVVQGYLFAPTLDPTGRAAQ